MDNNKNGAVILKSIPTKRASEHVAGYLKKVAKGAAYDKIVLKIRQTPTTLFKNVSAQTGKKIAADLIRLGATASFEPFVTASDHTSKTQKDTIGKERIRSTDASEDQEIHDHAKRSPFQRLSIVAIVLGLAACVFIFFNPFAQHPSKNTMPHNGKTAKQSDRHLAKKSGNQINKDDHSSNNVSTKDIADVAEHGTVAQKNAIRMGVYIFSSYTPGLGDLPYAKGLSDRLADASKNDPGIKFVDRMKIDQIVKQGSLTVKQLLAPEEAARVGQQAGADVIIVGQLIRKDLIDNKYKEKSVAVKAIHTASARTIDIGCFQYDQYRNYPAWFDHLTKFVKTAAAPEMSLDQRNFVVMGEFTDRSDTSTKQRYLAKLKKSLYRKLKYRQHVCIVSQSHLKHFFNTLYLNENGSFQNNENEPSAQPTYTLIAGDFIFNSKVETPFSMQLQVEFLGQTNQSLTVKGNSWDDGINNLGNEIDVLLTARANLDEQKRLRGAKFRECTEQGPVCEAKAHLKRGKELSNISFGKWPPYLNVSLYADGQGFSTRSLGSGTRTPDGKRQELSKERKLRNVRKAIDAFESALFLYPEYFEAKLFLAVCLSHPAIGETERSKGLLEEIVSKSTDDKLKFVAAKALGMTESVTYSPAFAEKTFTPEYYADTYAMNVHHLLWKDEGQVAWWTFGPAEMERLFIAIDKNIIAQCENVIWQSKTRKGRHKVDHALYKASTELKGLTWSVHRNEKIARHFKGLFSNIRKKYPRLAPNLIVDCNITRSVVLLEELLLTLRRVEEGVVKPLRPDKFSSKLRECFLDCAISGKREYLQGGVQIANNMARRNSLSSYDKMYLSCCYKGIGELDKALALLEQVDGANEPEIKQAFVDQPCLSFRKTLTAALRKKLNAQVAKIDNSKKKPRRTIEAAVKLSPGRAIHAIAMDGDTIWMCANKRQNPNAPSGRYDPVIYRYRIGTKEPVALKLPKKTEGMATAIIAKNNTIWIGTDEGLIEMQPDRNSFRHLKEDDGLLKPNINALSLSGNKLHIGLGSGIGYLDLGTHNFIGLITTNDVIRIDSTATGLWAITQKEGLCYFSDKTPNDGLQSIFQCANSYSLAANQRYVVIGKNLQVGRFFGMRNVGSAGLVIYDQKLKKKIWSPGNNAFAGTDVLSLAFAGDQLWVGGRGFLAVVNISEHKIMDQLAGKGSAFHALCPDNSGGMWVSQGHKLYHLGYGPDGFEKK